jgi:RNA polymerase sigma factor (sigma-70 family)
MSDPVPAAQLVARCRSGDQEAWAALVDRFSRYVYAIASQGFRLRDHDAEDVFQEVFTKAYRRLGDLRADDAIGPWLAGITRRTCLTRLRTRVEETVDTYEEPVDDAASLELVDRAMDVDAALQELPEACREILDRFFRLDQPYAEIADALEIDPGTVAATLARAHATLHDDLAEVAR